MPNDDGMLAWGKGGLGDAPGRRPTSKDVISTDRESWDVPAFPEYQAKGEENHEQKTSNS